MILSPLFKHGEVFIIQQTCDQINMNVNRIDESLKKLNYYCRNSPRKRKNGFCNQSPLLSSTSRTRSPPKSSRFTSIYSQPRSAQTSFKIQVQQIRSNSSYNQILIEEPQQEQILIEDVLKDNPLQERSEILISAFKSPIEAQEEEQNFILPTIHRQVRANDIRIQDDQISEQNILEEKGNRQNEASFQQKQYQDKRVIFELKNQQQQRMNRQFTFGQQFVEAQKAEIQLIPKSPKSPILEELSERQGSADDVISSLQDQFEYYFPEKSEFEQNYQAKSEKKVKHQKKLFQINVQEQFQDPFQLESYSSPKFNFATRKFEDVWITAEDYANKAAQSAQILIQQPPPSSRSSISKRPFFKSILLLNDILDKIPPELSRIYEQMHKKLILDQINTEEAFQKKGKIIETINTLILLNKEGLYSQKYLLSNSSDADQLIMINQTIIQSLIRKVLKEQQNKL